MPAAAIPLIAVGVGLSAYSSYQASQEKAKQLRSNARLAENAAADALQRGEQRAWQVRMTSSRRQGAQTLAYAHAGVDVASGSPAEVVSKTAMVGELEAQIQRNNAFREAYGYRAQASNLRGAADAAETAGYFNLAGTILGGAGKVAGMAGADPLGLTGADFSPGGSHEGWT